MVAKMPLVFFFAAYASITVVCWHLGMGTRLQFYFLVAATLMVLILGIDHIVLTSALAALGAATVIVLEVMVPNNTGAQPDWAFRWNFILTVASAWIMVVAVVWYQRASGRRDDDVVRRAVEQGAPAATP
jgi:adenylate cyclase